MSLGGLLSLALMGLTVLVALLAAYYAFRAGQYLLKARRSGDLDGWYEWAAKYFMARYRLHSLTCPFQWINAAHSHRWMHEKRSIDGHWVSLTFMFNGDEES